jgi:hypothetical protein
LSEDISTWRVFHVVDPGVDSEGRGAQKGHTPQHYDDSQGGPGARSGVRVDGLADGDVALRGERHYRQN